MIERRLPSLRDIVRRQARTLELSLGHPDKDGTPGGEGNGLIKLPYSARAAHMHVIGRTRSGKSRFIADLIRQDIVNNREYLREIGRTCLLTDAQKIKFQQNMTPGMRELLMRDYLNPEK